MAGEPTTNTAAAEDGGALAPTGEGIRELRRYVSSRLNGMAQQRQSWWAHWKELAEHILPRRLRWLMEPNSWKKGAHLNGKIINSVGTMAARNCASGIMSGTTSPSRPWFRMTVPDPEAMQDGDVQMWCDEVTQRIMRVMASSNYYGSKGIQYFDLVVFGTAPLIIYDDNDTVIRCFNPCAGEYYCAVGPNFDVNTLGRRFTMTVQQMVDEFGIKNVSLSTKSLYDQQTSARDQERVVCHLIEPNPDYQKDPRTPGRYGLARHFRFREVFWEEGTGEADKVLRVSGFLDQPFSCPRWDVSGNDPYGRSPGMDALGDIKQLQQQEKRKAQAIDKMVNPPMVADAGMKNEPASLLPGAITYVPSLAQGAVGFKPAFTSELRIGELKEDIARVERRIQDAFFNDLFLMISQMDTVRSATEIDARREEKLMMLGPAMDRLQREGLAADLNRIFQIMARRGLLPRPPDMIRGATVKVEYISLLADVQRASATAAIERLWGFAGNIGAAIPAVMDNLDPDQTMAIYGDMLRVPPKIMTSKRDKEAMRAKRSEEQQQASTLQTGAAAAQAGKVLSETDVGGGQNALTAMLGGG